MAAKDPNHDAVSRWIGSPIKAAAVLLGIYIAMYLAVGGIVRVLSSPDAAAAAAPDSLRRSRLPPRPPPRSA